MVPEFYFEYHRGNPIDAVVDATGAHVLFSFIQCLECGEFAVLTRVGP